MLTSNMTSTYGFRKFLENLRKLLARKSANFTNSIITIKAIYAWIILKRTKHVYVGIIMAIHAIKKCLGYARDVIII